jgi:hypothetical protein
MEEPPAVHNPSVKKKPVINFEWVLFAFILILFLLYFLPLVRWAGVYRIFVWFKAVLKIILTGGFLR